MSATQQEVLTSDLPDLGYVPLDAELAIDDAEYARIMRRIAGDGDAAEDVSAFNSSI